MPLGVTVVRETGIGWPCSRVWYSDSASLSGPIAAHVGDVEGEPLVEGRLGGVADEGRRHQIAFAVPERDDVAEFAGAQREVGDGLGVEIADLRANAVECVARDLATDDDWGGKNDKTGRFAHDYFHAIPDAKPLRTLAGTASGLRSVRPPPSSYPGRCLTRIVERCYPKRGAFQGKSFKLK